MSQNDTDAQWQDIVRAVLTRATRDEDFRRLCLQDPTRATEQIAGRPLPPGATIRYVDEGPEGILLPPLRSSADEIPENELAQISGGALTLYHWPCGHS